MSASTRPRVPTTEPGTASARMRFTPLGTSPNARIATSGTTARTAGSATRSATSSACTSAANPCRTSS